MAVGDPTTRVTENTILLRIIMTPVSRTRSFVLRKTTIIFVHGDPCTCVSENTLPKGGC